LEAELSLLRYRRQDCWKSSRNSSLVMRRPQFASCRHVCLASTPYGQMVLTRASHQASPQARPAIRSSRWLGEFNKRFRTLRTSTLNLPKVLNVSAKRGTAVRTHEISLIACMVHDLGNCNRHRDSAADYDDSYGPKGWPCFRCLRVNHIDVNEQESGQRRTQKHQR
jgi:hypothetical protein